jgi:L-iditol 2-dehydrogenase
MKVRSAYIKAPWQCEIREIELPETPPHGEVLIRVEACGICGSDLFTLEDKAKDWQPFGHEVAGVIEQLGTGCEHLTVGQKVVLETSGFCGKCDLCRNGRVELCRKAPHFWGGAALGFSDYMIVPQACVVPYEGLSPEIACLAEPAGVSMDMVLTVDIKLGSRVCIIGPGPIGLMAIPLALRSGAIEVVCIGRSHNEKRLAIATQLGAKAIMVDEPISKRTDLHGKFDRVITTAPVQFLPDAFHLLDFGGIISYIGFGVGDTTVSFDANDFHVRKLQLRSSYASPGIYLPQALEFLKADIIPGRQIISHVMELDDVAEAVNLYRVEKETTLKIVIRPQIKAGE